jgi:SAM domain (Sterile alpha motif)
MDVGGWLRSLGLGRYEAAFRDNAIDADVLADITDGERLGAKDFAFIAARPIASSGFPANPRHARRCNVCAR